MISKPEQQVSHWLRRMGIIVSPSLISEKLKTHPDYPTLCSVTDTLDELGIENVALIIDKERLQEVPLPFLAHDTARGEFVIINNIEQQIKANPYFEKNWSGTAVLAERQENWKNRENNKWLTKEKRSRQTILISLFSVILTGAFSLLNNFSWSLAGLLVTSFMGFAIAVLIVQHEFGISNDLTDQLCSAGKRTDCDAVLHSKGSQVNKWMNWADAGIIYFISYSLFLVTLLYTGNAAGIFLLAILSSAAVPFTLFSLYYQWQVIKKWCPLCLLTVGVLWLQFALLLPVTLGLSMGELSSVSFNTISFAAFIFFIVVPSWLLIIKPALQKNKKLAEKNFSLLRFKNNPDVFETFLKQQRKVDTIPFENDLQLGNPDAAIQIVVACSPYCVPCARAHKILHALAEETDMGLTIRFSVKAENNEDKRTAAASYIMQLVNNTGADFKRKILHDWYASMDLEKFGEKYPLPKKLNVQQQLQEHGNWNIKADISFTPTIFINGYELPKHYKVNELKRLIKQLDIGENATEKKQYALA